MSTPFRVRPGPDRPADPIALPPALTYMLARLVAEAERRGPDGGGGAAERRLHGLVRDAVRVLRADGVSDVDALVALHDVGLSLDVAPGAWVRDAFERAVAAALLAAEPRLAPDRADHAPVPPPSAAVARASPA